MWRIWREGFWKAKVALKLWLYAFSLFINTSFMVQLSKNWPFKILFFFHTKKQLINNWYPKIPTWHIDGTPPLEVSCGVFFVNVSLWNTWCVFVFYHGVNSNCSWPVVCGQKLAKSKFFLKWYYSWTSHMQLMSIEECSISCHLDHSITH